MTISSYSNNYNKKLENSNNTITDSIDSNKRISKYDEIIKDKSEKIGWDWRLVSSLIYQESKFNHKIVSKIDGSFGLMQFMPKTAKIFGINKNSSPDEQIEAGIKYLDILDKKLEKHVFDDLERKKFVIAAYNCGILPVYNAIKISKYKGKNYQNWKEVEIYLYNSSKKQNFRTRKYVVDIFSRYEIYKKNTIL